MERIIHDLVNIPWNQILGAIAVFTILGARLPFFGTFIGRWLQGVLGVTKLTEEIVKTKNEITAVKDEVSHVRDKVVAGTKKVGDMQVTVNRNYKQGQKQLKALERVIVEHSVDKEVHK